MPPYEFRVPYPPSVNRIWRRAGNVTYKTREAKDYVDALRAAFFETYRLMPFMIHGPVIVRLSVYRPTKRGDLDNVQKVLYDAMNGFIYADDSQIVEIHAYRYDAPKMKGVKTAGWVDVIIEEVEG